MQMKETMEQHLGETKMWNTSWVKEQKIEIIMRVALHVILVRFSLNWTCIFKNTAGIGANQYDEQFVVLFTLTMAQLKQVSLTYLIIW